jgi:hypothetical protein
MKPQNNNSPSKKIRIGFEKVLLLDWFEALSFTLFSLLILSFLVTQKSPLTAKIFGLMLPFIAAALLAPPADRMVAALVETNESRTKREKRP